MTSYPAPEGVEGTYYGDCDTCGEPCTDRNGAIEVIRVLPHVAGGCVNVIVHGDFRCMKEGDKIA